MKTYTQNEIAKLIGVPYCDVNFALCSCDPVGRASPPYRYEAGEAKDALTKYYEKKRALHIKQVQKYDERISALSALDGGEADG